MDEARPQFRQSVKTLHIVGVACGLGARDPRCATGPDVLRSTRLLARLQARGFKAVWADTIRPAASENDAVKAVADTAARLARRVESILQHEGFPVILGGDHSCAIGTWKGVAKALGTKGGIGLIWIDAHMDAHTPETSPSGALHGMPLACLLGYGDPALIAIAGHVRLDPRHVCLVGVRSFEAGEAELIKRLGVRVYYMHDIAQRGLEEVMREALRHVQRDTAGFGVTIDLDALDPTDAPGVSTPVPGGIAVDHLTAALAQLAHQPALLAMEIVEYNPYADRHAATAGLVSELLDAALAGQRSLRFTSTLADLEHRYGAHHYDPLPVVLVRGEGACLWDDEGRRYIDMMSAYSAVSHGHCHPRLTRVLAEQARTLALTSRVYYNNRLPLLLRRLCEITGQDMALPANTGLEAVEAALKVARKWAHAVKGVPQDQAEIIACDGNFHGRSIAILAMSDNEQYRRDFGPFPPGFKRIPYGDAAALAETITPHTAAFLVEPIQGEGGIIVPPAGYLAECARLCRSHNVLLICDEIQTGLGRTGKLFACEHEGVKPDGIILGKALGGGLVPVSAFVGRRDVMEVLAPGDHGSTFAGNPLAAAVALEAIEVIIEERLPERAAHLGDHLLRELKSIASPLVREVRGRGLMIGVELDTTYVPARVFCERLASNGVLTKDTRDSVIRFTPPLVITEQQIEEALAAIRRTFAEVGSGISNSGNRP
jgi:ornithine--oxo-acid transaminase